MANEPVLSVMLLWHQHQPFYKDPLSNRYELPWVRLHATKDYYDMVALLDEFPNIRVNFNLVPSLLQQLDDYGQGIAQDKFLTLTLKPAVELAFDDRLFLLNNFFMANWDTMIDPYPRYRELLEKRGRHSGGEELTRIQNYFKEQDWRDLQVWFNLCWFDPYWKTHDPFIQGLFDKAKNFSEEDKHGLIERQLKICGKVVARHKSAQDNGQIEITASPYYHPILPLLCDTDAAKVATPNTVLPQNRFQHPEDARTQIQNALNDHTQRFGRPPRGMWPSEGSVSNAAAQVLQECGVQWLGTDEGILAHSLPDGAFAREDIYEPYRLELGGKSLNFFFRDHELSDAIGFVYPTWKAEDAVQDFIKRLHGIRDRLLQKDGDHPRPHVVPIILDGENCWEYYQEDGLPFLRQLYKALSEDPTLHTVLGSEYLEINPPTKTLAKLWSGSWINANYSIWIGHREDNLAWDLLYRTRHFLVTYLQTHPDRTDSHEAKLAWNEIYIAEGSDWCWWYGDDHSSANDAAFDYLFRKHLMNVYSALGAKVPDDLRISIKPQQTRQAPKPPIDFITPKIDGRVSNYFEWQSAGVYLTNPGASGTMHRSQNTIQELYYGYDLKNLYFRIDFAKAVEELDIEALTFKLIFSAPEGYEVLFKIDKTKRAVLQITHKVSPEQVETKPLSQIVVGKIVEFGVPLDSFTGQIRAFEWSLVVEKAGSEQERWPTDISISYPFPAEENFVQSWTL